MPFPVIPLVTMIGGLITDWLSNKREKSQQKHKTAMAVEGYKQQLAVSKESHTRTWELESLKEASKFLKITSYLIFTAPFIVAIYDPQSVKDYFEVGLASIPDWYIYTYCGIMSAIWGIREMMNFRRSGK